MRARERLFCHEYILCKFNGTKAAIRAGFAKKSARVTAARLLTKANIKAEITRLTEELLGKKKAKAGDVINELAEVAFSDLAKMAKFNGETLSFKSFKEMGAASRTVRSIVLNRTPSGKDDKGNPIFEDHIKLVQHDKIRALELLGRHMELFTEKVDITSGGEILRPKIILPDNGRNPQHIARRSRN